ncbi:MAG: hypothetical protein JNK46_13700, partial [Methylobacteriaceae bacterium]|nr:hypothetical protein [Methylobacteriaceae bacterium]
MRRNARDVNAVVAYGVNAIALGLLPLGLLGLAAGVVLVALGGRDTILPGVAGTAVGVAVLVYAAYRNFAPSKPLLELAPQGARMRIPGATEFLIPWSEVRDVGVLDVIVENIPTRRGSTTARFDNVTTLAVSRAFYDRVIHLDSTFMRGPGWSGAFIPEGDGLVQVALHHELLRAPVDELREAVLLRWRAFGGAAPDGASARAASVRHVVADAGTRRRAVVVEHGAAPLMAGLGVVGLVVAALAYFQIWPFDAAQRRAEEEARRARQWAETERRIADDRLRMDETSKKMREDARRQAEADEAERRLAARRVEEIEARERAELLAGGPLPPPASTRIDGHRGAVLALGAARNERSFVSGGADGAVKLWDTRAAVALRDIGAHGAPVRAAIILPDGASALAGDDRGAIVWRALPEGETLHVFDAAQAGGVLALAVDAEARRLTSLHGSGVV